MKTTFKAATVIMIACIAFGCSKKATSESVVANGGTPVVPPVIIDPPNGGGGGIFSAGSTVDFVPTSLEVMNEYVATHPLNNPSQFKINVNLAQVQNGRYGGQVSLSYVDNGQQYNGVFKSGLGNNQTFSGMYDNGRLESDYNYWFRFNNQLIFSGFFEDQYGAITVTLVPVASATPGGGNDGEPIGTAQYKGYVYFKNFITTTAPHSPYRSCWFTYMGPYDCRSNVIQTKCGLYPGVEAGYKLLGTFTAINNRLAFNLSQ